MELGERRDRGLPSRPKRLVRRWLTTPKQALRKAAGPSRGAQLLKLGQRFQRRHEEPEAASATLSSTSAAIVRKRGRPSAWDEPHPNVKLQRAPFDCGTVPTNPQPSTGPPAAEPQRLPTTILAWGWGGEGRLGTGREAEEDGPSRLHPTLRERQIVAVAAGARHTLFLTRDGLAMSVGEAGNWQLGATSDWAGNDAATAPSRRVPVRVLPSGICRGRQRRDVTLAGISAGATCSFAMELSGEAAAGAVEELAEMEKGVAHLLTEEPDSLLLKRLFAAVQEERKTLNRRHRGRVFSWGTGRFGELGQGGNVDASRTPRPVKLLGAWLGGSGGGGSVCCLAAGRRHVLCSTTDGRAFAWGSNKDGRLGTGDWQDRWEPSPIQALRGRFVTLVAAGHAHSLAVTAPEAPPKPQRRRKSAAAYSDGRAAAQDSSSSGGIGVYCWGRGAHGRLGLGDLRSRHLPTRVTSWPASGMGRCSCCTTGGGGINSGDSACSSSPPLLCKTDSGVSVVGAALGGAHTLLLTWTAVPSCMRYPLGRVTTILAWGCGANGQLGTGEAVELMATPRVVKLERDWCIEKIAAGKAHSLAVTAKGSLLAWGKGWLGELGVAKPQAYRVAPAPVEFAGSSRHIFVSAAAGDRHSLALSLETRPARSWAQHHREDALRHVKAAVGAIGVPPPSEASFLASWRCPRRPPRATSVSDAEPWMACVTCGHDCICLACCKACHAGHEVGVCRAPRKVLCRCGMRPRRFTAAGAAAAGDSSSVGCRLLGTEYECEHACGGGGLQQNTCSAKIQRAWRAWKLRCRAAAAAATRAALIRSTAAAAWNDVVVGAVVDMVNETKHQKALQRENADMAAADKESAFYRYYRKLQPVLQALELQRNALRALAQRGGATIVLPVAQEPLEPARRHSTVLLAPPPQAVTFWTRCALRQALRTVSPRVRPPESVVTLRMAALPSGAESSGSARRWEGGVPDPDVNTLALSAQKLYPSDFLNAKPGAASAATLAAPENLYERSKRAVATRQQSGGLRRRFSVSEGLLPRVDKTSSPWDRHWAELLACVWRGVDESLSLTRALQVGEKRTAVLANRRRLGTRKGARRYARFLSSLAVGSGDADAAAILERRRRGRPTDARSPTSAAKQRSHSLCAPERACASLVTWEHRLSAVTTIMAAGAAAGYPAAEGAGAGWTRRLRAAMASSFVVGGSGGSEEEVESTREAQIAALAASSDGIMRRAARAGVALPERHVKKTIAVAEAHQIGIVDIESNGGAQAASLLPQMPTNWLQLDDGTGNLYYWNSVTNESTWTAPLEGFVAAAAQSSGWQHS